MITLCLDTSHKYMGIAIIENNEVVAERVFDCFKKQSEYLLPKTDELMKEHGYRPSDIERIVVTKGPGSYTGVRIAMTVAKTLGCLADVKVSTISSLRLYTGGENGMTVIDARSGRAYVGYYRNSETWEGILTLDEIKEKLCLIDCRIFGDGDLIELSENYKPVGECFLDTMEYWEEVENIHALVPEYFKGLEGYRQIND